MFKSAADLSILTSESRSLMILVSRSISPPISCINSRYSSIGTSSCPFNESASTFIEVSGVFNSWETLDTNSCLESSSTFIRAVSSLNLVDISCVSEKSSTLRSLLPYPVWISSMDFDILRNGLVRHPARNTATARITSALITCIVRILVFK